MDWKTFAAEVVGHVAWPSVIAFSVWLMRARLSPLLDRLEELTIGGATARFRQVLAEAEKEKERLAREPTVEGTLTGSTATTPSEGVPPRSASGEGTQPQTDTSRPQAPPKGFTEMAATFPQAAVVVAYGQVEDAVADYARAYPKAQERSVAPTMGIMLEMGLISDEVYSLFRSAVRLRNIAVHDRGVSITEDEVLAYWDTCALLASRIREALAAFLQKQGKGQLPSGGRAG